MSDSLAKGAWPHSERDRFIEPPIYRLSVCLVKVF